MRSSNWFSIIDWALVFALVLGLTTAGGCLLFSSWVPYDDEGYTLLTLRNFSANWPLYDSVYTQYGPAFFLIEEAIRSALRMDWTSDSVRVLTLLNWVGTAICSGMIVLNRTRSKVLGALGLTLTFIYLVDDISEPGHPGSMIALLVSVAAFIGSKWDIAEQPGAAATIGALGATVALMKVNVGGFLLIAAVFWILLRGATGKSGYGRFLLYSSLVALPWILMKSVLIERLSSVTHFVLTFDSAIVGLFLALEVTPRTAVRKSALVTFIIGALAATIVVLILTISRGTSLSGLISGVLLDPMRLPTISFLDVKWNPLSPIASIGALGLAVGYYLRPSSEVFRSGIILGRLLALAVLLFTVVRPSYMALAGLNGLSVAALCAFPLRWDDAAIPDARFRQWIATLLVLQSLHAYPVAGSQVSWGTYLLVPLVLIAIKEVWDSTSLVPTASIATWSTTLRSVGICLSILIAARILVGGLQKFNDGEWLELPGAEYLSLPVGSVLTFRTLSENVRAYGDQLFSVPGSFSFNLWTSVPTPTLANGTLWDGLLNSDAQNKIMSRLRDDYRAVILRRAGIAFAGKLGCFIEREFTPAFSVGEYEFLVHRGRRIAPLSTASIRLDPIDPNYARVRIILRGSSSPITSIEIWKSRLTPASYGSGGFLELPGKIFLARLDERPSSVWLTPLNEDGTPSGEIQSSAWPVLARNAVTLLEGRFDARLMQKRDLFFVVRSTDRTIAAVPISGLIPSDIRMAKTSGWLKSRFRHKSLWKQGLAMASRPIARSPSTVRNPQISSAWREDCD